jgi:cytochrome c peroxidase
LSATLSLIDFPNPSYLSPSFELCRVEVYLHLNGLVERRRVELLQLVGEHRERVFRPREHIDDELAITNCQLRNVDKRPSPAFVKAYGHNGYFASLKEIVHFYNTRDVLARCKPHDAGEGTTCWPAPESTDNMNTSKMAHLGLSDAEEDPLVAFMQTLTDGFTSRDQP